MFTCSLVSESLEYIASYPVGLVDLSLFLVRHLRFRDSFYCFSWSLNFDPFIIPVSFQSSDCHVLNLCPPQRYLSLFIFMEMISIVSWVLAYFYCLDGCMLLDAFMLVLVGFICLIADIIKLQILNGFLYMEQSFYWFQCTCWLSLPHRRNRVTLTQLIGLCCLILAFIPYLGSYYLGLSWLISALIALSRQLLPHFGYYCLILAVIAHLNCIVLFWLLLPYLDCYWLVLVFYCFILMILLGRSYIFYERVCHRCLHFIVKMIFHYRFAC